MDGVGFKDVKVLDNIDTGNLYSVIPLGKTVELKL